MLETEIHLFRNSAIPLFRIPRNTASFGNLVPETIDFKVGYFFGKQSTKYWLMCQEDIETMNKNLTKSKGSFMLWCDARQRSYHLKGSK